MRTRHIYLTFAVLVATFFTTASYGQILSRGDLFGPGAPPARAGVEVGIGLNRQEGTFNAACNCEFADGKGTGFIANLVFELPLNYDWAISLKAGVNAMTTASDVIVIDNATIRYEPGDSLATGKIRFNRHGDVSTTYLTLIPGVKYQFFRGGPFIQLGAGIGFLVLGNSFTHTRQLSSSTVVLEDGSTVEGVTFESGTLEETLEDGEIKDVEKLRLSAIISAGYDIPLSDKALISPMVGYDFPFTTLRSNSTATDWKISSLQLMVGLKFILE
jgi:hypothetical protein